MADAQNYNEWLFRRARPLLGARALDFGAGLGTFTELIAKEAEVVAVEPDADYIPRLHARFDANPRVSIVLGDESALDELGAFDSVVCLNVLEHIRDDGAVFRRFADRLRPGGHLLVLVPAHQALYGAVDESVGHERRYNRRLLRGRLLGAGFEPVELRYVNPVGAAGWLVSSRLLRRDQVPAGPLKLYDALVPVLRPLDRLPLPFGLSLWAVGRKTSS